jgi:mono/diheme cytochrome c family protein
VSGASHASGGNDPGRQLFVKDATPSCAICHTLADAGASGAIGPSLDELKPDATRVVKALKTGIGQMPAYPQLSEEQVQALARYVARASGAAK